MIEFNEEKHIYSVDGRQYPSVTDICSPITSDHYGAINAAILEQAARRGTAVHEATQLIDLDAMPEDDPEIDPYINAYLDFLLDYKPHWEYVEHIGFCDRLEYGFCGTVDRAGRVGDEYWVLDIKTTASPTKENYIATCCQTTAYALMIHHDEAKRKILYLKKDGSYRLVDCEEKENELMLDSYWLFTTLLEVKSYIQKVKEIKRGKRN